MREMKRLRVESTARCLTVKCRVARVGVFVVGSIFALDCRRSPASDEAGAGVVPLDSSEPRASVTPSVPSEPHASVTLPVPFDAVWHCADLTRVARSKGLLPGERETLTVSSGTISLADDEPERVEPGVLVPLGFASCTNFASIKPSLNMRNRYRCETSPGAPSSPEALDALSRAWRSCLKPPTWKPASSIRSPNDLRSRYAGVPDAYVSTFYREGPVTYTEASCILERHEGVITMMCGTSRNN